MRSASAEFSTWVALAFGAIAIALATVFSSSLWVLIPAGLVGGALGYGIDRMVWLAVATRRSRGRDL